MLIDKIKSAFRSEKQIISIALLFIMFGTLIELYLINHYEDILQLIPILIIIIALINLFFLFFRVSNTSKKLFKFILVLVSFVGLFGFILHMKANYEFEQEMRPSSNWTDLFVESLSGALPTLAPLSMVVLSLIGYSYLIILNHNK